MLLSNLPAAGNAAGNAGGFGVVVDAIDTVTAVVSGCFDMLTGNAFTVFLLAVTVVGIGLGIFKRAKHSA